MKTDWTSTPPKKPGMYLTRHSGSDYPVPVQVKRKGRGLTCLAHGYGAAPMKDVANDAIEWMEIEWGEK